MGLKLTSRSNILPVCIILFGLLISSAANSNEEKSTNTTSEEFTVSAENQFAGRNHDSDFSWLDDALRDIAYYLKAHKFNEYDRRYHTDASTAPRDYFATFPRPPLRSLHWEVHRYCEPSFISCVEYLSRRVKNTGLRRSDDTAIVIQEQNWNKSEHSKQIDAVEDECRKMLKADDVVANPFEGPIERLRWRTSASYYMCWYTMNEVTDLAHLKENCDNFSNCLDPNFGPNNADPRANDAEPYACALYSFCPDPCCQIKHLKKLDECWSSSENPCFTHNSSAPSKCSLSRPENTNFEDAVLNRWNLTCECSQKGFEWNSKYGICVDIDECVDRLHGCDTEREACVNLQGSFRCACLWGYAWNSSLGYCLRNPSLEIIRANSNATGKGHAHQHKAQSIIKLLKLKIFGENSSTRPKSENLVVVAFSWILLKFVNF